MKTTAARICLAFNPSLYIWLCLLTMDVGRLVSTHPGLAGGQYCTVPLRVAVQGPLPLLPFLSLEQNFPGFGARKWLVICRDILLLAGENLPQFPIMLWDSSYPHFLKAKCSVSLFCFPCNCLQICKTLLLSQLSFVDAMLCLFPTVITWFVSATNQFEQCDRVCMNPIDEIVILFFLWNTVKEHDLPNSCGFCDP